VKCAWESLPSSRLSLWQISIKWLLLFHCGR